jgi:hypothetical protein
VLQYLHEEKQYGREVLLHCGYTLPIRGRYAQNSYPFPVRTKLRGLSPQSELFPPSDRRLSVKLVSTFADRRCHVVSVTDPQAVFLVF